MSVPVIILFYSNNIQINGYTFFGTGLTKNAACINTVLDAFKHYKKYYNSGDADLRKTFVNIARELHQQMWTCKEADTRLGQLYKTSIKVING